MWAGAMPACTIPVTSLTVSFQVPSRMVDNSASQLKRELRRRLLGLLFALAVTNSVGAIEAERLLAHRAEIRGLTENSTSGRDLARALEPLLVEACRLGQQTNDCVGAASFALQRGDPAAGTDVLNAVVQRDPGSTSAWAKLAAIGAAAGDDSLRRRALAGLAEASPSMGAKLVSAFTRYERNARDASGEHGKLELVVVLAACRTETFD